MFPGPEELDTRPTDRLFRVVLGTSGRVLGPFFAGFGLGDLVSVGAGTGNPINLGGENHGFPVDVLRTHQVWEGRGLEKFLLLDPTTVPCSIPEANQPYIYIYDIIILHPMGVQ